MRASRLTAVCIVFSAASVPSCLWADTVNVLIVADTNDHRIGKSVAIDVINLTEVFRSHVPPRHLRLHTVFGNRVSKREILKALKRFRAKKRDAMVFFWSGHGAYDQRGHFFAMPNKDRLYRTEVVQAVKRRGARLNAVLSCSCNVFVPLAAAPAPAAAAPATSAPPRRRYVAPLFKKLFLEARGLVDINGASEGQYSLAGPIDGSTFLGPFVSYLSENAERTVGWSTVIREVRPRVHLAFRAICPESGIRELRPDGTTFTQFTQTVRVWHIPEDRTDVHGNPAVRQRSRFGVVTTENRGDGVMVLSVYDGFPGSNVTNLQTGSLAMLERGDVIRSVNGRKIRDTRDFWNAVKGSPTPMTFVIRCVRCRKEHRMRAHLRDGS